MTLAQIKKLSDETLANIFEGLWGALGAWGEVEEIHGWQKPQWVIEAETLFIQVEAEMCIRPSLIAHLIEEIEVNS